jgi:hypothetical protein
MTQSLNEYPEDRYDVMELPDLAEAWVYATMADVNDIIKQYGVSYFVEKLPRYSKIALISYWREHADSSRRSSTGD